MFCTAIVFVAIYRGALNITMGYSSKNNPAQILIAKLFKMHTNALSRNAKVMFVL
jgi:tRNA A37 threonylcarbamoyladenosine dehydratase